MLARLAFLATLLCAGNAARAAIVNVLVADAAGKPLADAVVMLEPVGAPLPVKPMANAQIAQKELQFNPQVTVVTVGTPVLFPNQDTVKHHVYSYSAAKTFQIKLYAGVPHTPIAFDKPGIAVLGCNIHDRMVAWVVVVDTPYFGQADAHGAVHLDNVPPGSYRLRSWHAGLPPGTAALDEALVVDAGGASATVKLPLATSAL